MSRTPCNLDSIIYSKLRLRMFGTEIRAIGGQIPDVCELVNSLINQFYGAAPNLLAILGVLDCFMKTKAAIDSVPEAILNLDPGALIDAIGEVTDCFLKNIIPLLPNPSVIYAIYDLIGLLIAVLDCVESRLLTLSSILAQSGQVQLDAEESGSLILKELGLCMEDDGVYVNEGMSEGLFGTIGILFGILGSLMSILQDFVGGPEALKALFGMDEDDYLPDFNNVFGDLSGRGLEYILEFTGAIRRDVLGPIYDSIGKVEIGGVPIAN